MRGLTLGARATDRGLTRVRRPGRGERGSLMIESIVALSIFLLVSASVTTVLVQTTTMASNNQRHVAAENLANQEIEYVRGMNLDSPVTGTVSHATTID